MTAVTDTEDHLDRYILLIIGQSKLIDTKTILIKVRQEYGRPLHYEELMVRLKALKSRQKIEPVVMDTRKITGSSLWKLRPASPVPRL